MQAYPMFVGYTDEEVRARYFNRDIEAGIKVISVEGHAAKAAELKNVKNAKGALYVDLSNIYGTPVLNQGACGSCYAFSSADTVNMNNLRSRNGKPLLSEQQLVDCSYHLVLLGGYNNGCGGGNIYVSMEYQKQYGLASRQSYPQSSQNYLYGTQQPCSTNAAPRFKINNWWYFSDYSCYTRMAYIQSGYALSVFIAAGNPYFWYYKSGILPDCYGYYNIDHAVVMVGFYYDFVSLSTSYIIIKNSWGTAWG
jgi:cysteine peptidase B